MAKKFEIIVVNDGSTDNTKTIVDRLVEECRELHIVSHTTNKGYGAALRTGIVSSKMEWVFWMDGDLQFDIKSLEKFIGSTDTYDAIIGYRAHRADTFLRKVNGELYTRLINLLFGMNIRDIDCACKLIKKTQLDHISIETSSAFTSSEILIKLKQIGVRFKQLPVTHFPRRFGHSSGGSFKVIFKGLKETLFFFLKLKMSSVSPSSS